VLEDFNFEAPKTKQYINMLSALSLADKKTLLVLPESTKNVVLAGRNLKNTKITTADQINTYDVMNAQNVIFVESSVSKVENLLNKE
jgi:large subunit ribosomal protein L4